MSVNTYNSTTGNLNNVAGGGGNSSNPNLLDNPFFTVNQRGQSSYNTVNAYTVDRWILDSNGEASISINNNGVGLTRISGYISYLQKVEKSRFRDSKRYTFSILFNDGHIESKSGIITDQSSQTRYIETDAYNDYVGFVDTWANANFYTVGIYNTAGTTSEIGIRAIKLELGTVSTLAMDTAPNYATELLKCQRYFYRLKNNINEKNFIGIGYARTSDILYDLIIPVEMRTTPTLTKSTDAISYTKLYASGSVVASSVALYYKSTNRYGLTIGGSNLTQETCYMIYLAENGYLDLSADL